MTRRAMPISSRARARAARSILGSGLALALALALAGPQPGRAETPAPVEDGGGICDRNLYSNEACLALVSLNMTWEQAFGQAHDLMSPTLLFFDGGSVQTGGCGVADDVWGPFYCPDDMTIYLDTSFFDDVTQLSGERADFARIYIIAHEYGHHIQNLTGVEQRMREREAEDPESANAHSVMFELQADCLAGRWAGMNRNLLEPGDIAEGMLAASTLGDDALMRAEGLTVTPESFTHGSSQQRMEALRKGMENADEASCDDYFDVR